MRIIAGEFRGRLIRGPQGRDTTRPITDRVKESLFNILRSAVVDAHVADCFCGTGSLGIESLSRGAERATFIDNSAPALAALRANLDDLHAADRAEVCRLDFLRKGLPEPKGHPFGVVFFDPPYRLTERDAAPLWLRLGDAVRAGHLAGDAVIVWRHDARHGPADPPPGEPLAIDDRRKYGSQTLTFVVPRHEMSNDELPNVADPP